jgi:3-hydroxybutyrate dehydrogenase
VEQQINDQALANNLRPDQVVNEIMLAPAAIKRLIEPEEIASMALYLCGPNSNSISGSSFVIDNGWTAR